MISRLEALRAKRSRGEDGFTLIELLVVVVIIGILVAIAIPLYLNYRQGAANKSLESDVRAAVSTVEQCIGENNNVPPSAATSGSGSATLGTDVVFTCGGTTSGSPAVTTGATTETAKVGSGNQLTYTFVAGATGTAGSYTIIGKNNNETVTYTSATSTTQKASGGLT